MDQSGWHIRCICLADRVPLLTSHTSLPYFPFSPCRSRQRVTPTFVKGHVRNTLGEEEKKRHAPIVWSGNATDAANDIQAIKKKKKVSKISNLHRVPNGAGMRRLDGSTASVFEGHIHARARARTHTLSRAYSTLHPPSLHTHFTGPPGCEKTGATGAGSCQTDISLFLKHRVQVLTTSPLFPLTMKCSLQP